MIFFTAFSKFRGLDTVHPNDLIELSLRMLSHQDTPGTLIGCGNVEHFHFHSENGTNHLGNVMQLQRLLIWGASTRGWLLRAAGEVGSFQASSFV